MKQILGIHTAPIAQPKTGQKLSRRMRADPAAPTGPADQTGIKQVREQQANRPRRVSRGETVLTAVSVGFCENRPAISRLAGEKTGPRTTLLREWQTTHADLERGQRFNDAGVIHEG